jgi:hypothetical protein
MAISTIQFIINSNNYDLPSASGYDERRDYTSVPLRMANGRTIWQAFPIQGDEDPSYIYHFTVRWSNLTIAERNTLVTAFGLMRAGNNSTFRNPEGSSFNVKIDPDSPGLELQGFAVAQTMRYRATIHLIDDEA